MPSNPDNLKPNQPDLSSRDPSEPYGQGFHDKITAGHAQVIKKVLDGQQLTSEDLSQKLNLTKGNHPYLELEGLKMFIREWNGIASHPNHHHPDVLTQQCNITLQLIHANLVSANFENNPLESEFDYPNHDRTPYKLEFLNQLKELTSELSSSTQSTTTLPSVKI